MFLGGLAVSSVVVMTATPLKLNPFATFWLTQFTAASCIQRQRPIPNAPTAYVFPVCFSATDRDLLSHRHVKPKQKTLAIQWVVCQGQRNHLQYAVPNFVFLVCGILTQHPHHDGETHASGFPPSSLFCLRHDFEELSRQFGGDVGRGLAQPDPILQIFTSPISLDISPPMSGRRPRPVSGGRRRSVLAPCGRLRLIQFCAHSFLSTCFWKRGLKNHTLRRPFPPSLCTDVVAVFTHPVPIHINLFRELMSMRTHAAQATREPPPSHLDPPKNNNTERIDQG